MTGLSVRGLTLAGVARGRPAVEDISFSAPAGAVTALLGNAGSGKTMLLAGIAGLIKPLRGAVFVSGADVSSAKAGKRGVALLPPGTDLGADRKLAAALHKVAGRAGAERADALIELFGLAPMREVRVAGLTHGQGFAALAVARLLGAGDVLLVDDAGTGLAPDARASLMRWLWRQAEDGRTIVLATRDRALALAADQLVLLQDGGVLQAGAPASVYAEPRDLNAARLTGEVNVLYGVVRQKVPGGFVWMAEGSRFTQSCPGPALGGPALGGPAFGGTALGGPALGGPVRFCLRPEQLDLAVAGGNAVAGRVVRLACLGGRTETWLETTLGTLIMHAPGPARLRTGQDLAVGWDAGAPWPLPEENGAAKLASPPVQPARAKSKATANA
jgi:ABC-type Fe3+/spermidine/putrescine transport system ATPase subunit